MLQQAMASSIVPGGGDTADEGTMSARERSRKRALRDRSNSLPAVARPPPAGRGQANGHCELPPFRPKIAPPNKPSRQPAAAAAGLSLPPAVSSALGQHGTVPATGGATHSADASAGSGGFQRAIDRHVTDVNQRRKNLEWSKLESRRLLQELSERKEEFELWKNEERQEAIAGHVVDAEIARWDAMVKQKKEKVMCLRKDISELRAKKNNTVEEMTQLSKDFMQRAHEMKQELRDVCAQYSQALENKEIFETEQLRGPAPSQTAA